VLDFLESKAGRVAFKLPDPHATVEKELIALSHLIKEVGEALRASRKLWRTEWWKKCASLKYVLEGLCKKRKKKTKS
jgi:hypothetical protein